MGVRESQKEIDFSQVLDCIRRVKTEVDFTSVLRAIHEVKRDVDPTKVLKAIRETKTDVDLSGVLREIRSCKTGPDYSAEAFGELQQVRGLAADLAQLLDEVRTSNRYGGPTSKWLEEASETTEPPP